LKNRTYVRSGGGRGKREKKGKGEKSGADRPGGKWGANAFHDKRRWTKTLWGTNTRDPK